MCSSPRHGLSSLELSGSNLLRQTFFDRPNTVGRRLLDVSDCAESPLLGESKHRRKWGRRNWMDSYLVPYSDLRSRSHPRIEGLTEAYFKGETPSPDYVTQLEKLLRDFGVLDFEDTPQNIPQPSIPGRVIKPVASPGNFAGVRNVSGITPAAAWLTGHKPYRAPGHPPEPINRRRNPLLSGALKCSRRWSGAFRRWFGARG